MTNHESHHLIKEIIQSIIEQIEQREKIEAIEQQTTVKTPFVKTPFVKTPFKMVSNKQYHYVTNCIRFFLMENGLFECCLQSKFPMLSLHNGYTNQLYLEHELLQNPDVTGYFCVANVNSANPDSTPTVEFVINGDIHILESFIHHLLIYLCYHNISKYTIKDYSYITNKLNMDVNYLSNAVKQKIYKKFGAVCLIKNYPSNTVSHWTIKKNNINDTYDKLVTILSGVESIISYEMSSDKNYMRNQFHAICDSVDVNIELDQYLSQSFITRSYGNIFTLKIIDSMIKERLIPHSYM